MRKILVLLFIITSSFVCLSQPVTIGRITNLKDGFGAEVTYIGEIKNKLPNGFGLFIYTSSSNALRHAGYFVNGLPEEEVCWYLKMDSFQWNLEKRKTKRRRYHPERRWRFICRGIDEQ
jgi:hypothetical protein